jgi:predicted amidohydrolase YtcJ
VITVDSTFSVAEAVLVENGWIQAVGSTEDLQRHASTKTDHFDLNGRTLMPGFIDTHGHVALFGLDELKVSLDGATTKAAILDRIAARVRATRAGEWIVSMPIGDPPYFLNAETLRASRALPTRTELDQVAPDNPVYIQAPTNRVPNFAVLNSAALAAARIDVNTNVSRNSRAIVNETGDLTGVLEGALQPIYNADPLYQMVEGVAPKTTYRDIRDGIAMLAPAFASHGTTTLLEAHLTHPEELRAYAELLDEGRLPLRIFYTFEIDASQPLDAVEEYLRTLRFAADGGFGSDRLKVCGISIGLDGPYWHGAAVHDQPYPGPFGDMVHPEPLVPWETYLAIFELAASMGFRIHAEGAGRRSIEIALRAFDRIDRNFPVKDKRHVLEHCEFPTKKQIAECARLGIAPTTSTNFIWGKGAEVYKGRLGENYVADAIPLRAWLDGGVPIAQSTDWGPHEAFFTLWQSIARRAGLTGEVIGSGQQISREEAIRCFTAHAAWALKMEHELGTIESGKRADLVVVNGDPLACPLDDLKDLEIDLTMIGGEVVFTR